MVKYPIGESSFSEIINGGYIYVDKTMYVHQLVNMAKFCFLSRPRRFGKSLLISTMENYFRGNRDLFRGLAIDSLEPEEWISYPVLHLDLTRGGYSKPEDLILLLDKVVTEWENEYGESYPSHSPDWRFDRLIRDIYERTGRQVVILIDEYDSPIVDVHGNSGLESINRKILHDFYRVMKANTDCLRFVFLTGVGKLGQLSIFSGLNNLLDISLDSRYAAICGITETELTDCFNEGIQDLSDEIGLSREETLQRLKEHYDGYHFSQKMVDIYNPYSVIKSLYYRHIGDYWFQSGTPTRLVRQFLENDWGTPDLEDTEASRSVIESGDVMGDDLALACFYTGYLTIKAYNPRRDKYTLGYPNAEVRNGFFNDLLAAVKKWSTRRTSNFVDSLRDMIEDDDIDGFLKEMQSFLAGIPYLKHTDKESQWQKDIMIIGRLVGLSVEVEKYTSNGRIDMVLEGTKAIYVLEFKYGGTPEEALKQIKEKQYARQYENTLNRKPVVKVGVSISPVTRNIDTWLTAR